MFVSVVVPFRNEQRHIARCCDALLGQSYPRDRYEIVLIDNDSMDGSADIVRQRPAITLLSESRRGSYAARNRGLSAARGEVVAFTDSDCVPDPDWVANIADAMRDPTLQIAVGSYLPATPTFALSVFAEYENCKNAYIFGSQDATLYYGYTNNLAARAALFREMGPFVDRPRGSDAVFARRVVERYGCGAVRHFPELRVRHLEIDRISGYFSKARIHADSLQRLDEACRVRPLNARERLTVFRSMTRERRLGTIRSMAAFGLLGVGLAYWAVGVLDGGRARPCTRS